LYAAVLNDLDSIEGLSPGCAVGIVRGDDLIFEQYKGFSSLKYESPIDRNTIFNIGSISKHLTAAVFFQLERKGVLSREEVLSKYFPEGPVWFNKISLGQLVTHESGIPDYRNDYGFAKTLISIINEELIYSSVAGLNISNSDIVKLILLGLNELSNPAFTPGTGASYSNTGYLLLAEIIRLQTGQEFDELIQEFIFNPYGLSDTKIHSIFTDDLKWLATGYGKDSLLGNQRGVIKSYGDTGVLTTLRDFSKWISVLNSADDEGSNWHGFLVDPLGNETPRLDGIWYQNGLQISNNDGLLYSHDGFSTDGMVSDFWISPEDNIGYMKLCNFNYSSIPSMYEVSTYLEGLSQ